MLESFFSSSALKLPIAASTSVAALLTAAESQFTNAADRA